MTMTATTVPDKRARKADAEQKRRDRIRIVDGACAHAGISQRYHQLNADQRTRAEDPDRPGDPTLLAIWILDGARITPPDSDQQRLQFLMDKGRERGFSAQEVNEVEQLRDRLGLSDRARQAQRTKPGTPRKSRKAGVMQLVEQVLTQAGEPMRVKDLADAVVQLDQARPEGERSLTGKTPHATVTARIYVTARDGGIVEQVAKGTFALRAQTTTNENTEGTA